MVFDHKPRFVGSIESFEHAVVEGDLEGMKFVCYYVNMKDEITGVLAVGKDPICAAVAELMRLKKMPKASELMMGTVNSDVILEKLRALNRAD